MRERSIVFTAAMVRALLAGSKTQTRLALNPQPIEDRAHDHVDERGGMFTWWAGNLTLGIQHQARCPYGQPGDRLWVREGYRFSDAFDNDSPTRVAERCLDAGYSAIWAPIQYDADSQRRDWRHTGTPPHTGAPQPGKGRPSTQMPRWASRILLEIVSVRVERLKDISEADCWAEGIEAVDGALDDMAIYEMARRMNRPFEDAAPTYGALWESINGAGRWSDNPWVWVITFKRISPAPEARQADRGNKHNEDPTVPVAAN